MTVSETARRTSPSGRRGLAVLAGQTEDRAARYFLYSAVLWLMVSGLVGLFMAAFLYAPAVQGLIPSSLQEYLTFGRVRPLHVNVMIFGWISMVWVGSMLYLTPRLTGTQLFSEPLARLTLVLWNLMILSGAISLLLGFTQGREYAELAWPLDLLFLALFGLLAVNIWGTVWRRREPRLYISVWSFMAASLIAPLVYAVGNKVWDPSGAYTGMNDAIINYFYVHNVFNAWFTTIAIGLTLYLLPKLSGNPLYSHRLAIWGFTSVWTGQHHLLYGPGPEWLEILAVAFSFLAGIANGAFLWNFLKTMEGKWHLMGQNVALRFLAAGCVFYIFTCLQGIAQSVRSFNAYVHFTNWVIGHSHLAFVADYSFFAFALIYTLLPRMLGRPILEKKLMEWHFWLTLAGLTTFMVVLWAAGLVQGQNWSVGGIPFIETVRSMKPYMFLRLLSGATIGVAQVFFIVVVWRTVQGGAVTEAPRQPVQVANA